LFEFVRRKAHLVHAFAKTLQTRLWFEAGLILIVVFAVALVIAVDIFAVAGAATVVVDVDVIAVGVIVVMIPVAAHPGHRRSVVLLLLFSLMPLRLSVFSPLVIETDELLFVVRQFHRLFGLEAIHEFADALLPGSLVFRFHGDGTAAHGIGSAVVLVVIANDSEALDHAFPQEALLARCLVLFGLFLDPFRVLVDGRFRQLPETALAATAKAAAGRSLFSSPRVSPRTPHPHHCYSLRVVGVIAVGGNIHRIGIGIGISISIGIGVFGVVMIDIR